MIMDATILARWQFGVTTVYHFLFVPLTLGLSILVAVLATLGYKRKDEEYKKLSEFFGKLFFVNFAVGLVTGIVQEFQFGMNWAGYSRFVGDIFGAPLAIEALSAFFLESTFLGIWIFGKDRISEKARLASIWVVAFASNLSAFWILAANSFMHWPQGYVIRNGRAEMESFWALISNQHVRLEFSHVFTSALTTAACFIAGVAAYKLIKGGQEQLFSKALRVALPVGLVALIATALAGHYQTQFLAKNIPMKLAAMEAHWNTSAQAPLALFAVIDEKNKKNTFEIAIPGMLSFMSDNNFNFPVQGINNVQQEYEKSKTGPGNYIPPVNVLFYSFRAMVGAGTFLILVFFIALIKQKKQNLTQSPKFLKVLFFCLFLPYIANSTGWIITEMGRQPWLVFKELRVEDGISRMVLSGEVLFTLIGFTLIYGVLAVVDVYLLQKIIKKYTGEPEELKEKEAELWA